MTVVIEKEYFGGFLPKPVVVDSLERALYGEMQRIQ